MNNDAKTLGKFVEYLTYKFKNKKHIIQELSELLHLNGKTVQKKLTGKSPFTYGEIEKIAQVYDLDLNEIVKEHLPYNSLKLFTPDWTDIEGSQNDLDMFLDIYRTGAAGGNAEVMFASNTYPKFILSQCNYLNKIDWLAYRYYNELNFKLAPGEYKNIQLDNKFNIEFMNIISSYKKLSCILNIHMMVNITEMLTYFYRTKLLDKEDISSLIEDCEHVIDWLEKICCVGALENGMPVEIFYSELSLPMDYNIIYSDNFKWGSIQLHFDHVIFLDTPQVIDDIATGWFSACKKSANGISAVSEISRNYFFAKQRNDFTQRLSKIIVE